MRKKMMLQASGAVVATMVLGSVLSGTAFAATTANNHSATHSTHAPVSVSYDHRVLALITQLENSIRQSTLKSNIDSKHTVAKISGGPMTPTSGSQVNPGGPMISASGSHINPGGPMIPASGPQVNPGGPMIPASTSHVTDAVTFQHLMNAANLFTQMLRVDQMHGNSTIVNIDRSQADRVLRALRSTFQTSAERANDISPSSFTPAELSSAHCATQFLLGMVNS